MDELAAPRHLLVFGPLEVVRWECLVLPLWCWARLALFMPGRVGSVTTATSRVDLNLIRRAQVVSLI